MPTHFQCAMFRQGFTVEHTLLIPLGAFPLFSIRCCKSESSTQAMLPHAWQPVLLLLSTIHCTGVLFVPLGT